MLSICAGVSLRKTASASARRPTRLPACVLLHVPQPRLATRGRRSAVSQPRRRPRRSPGPSALPPAASVPGRPSVPLGSRSANASPRPDARPTRPAVPACLRAAVLVVLVASGSGAPVAPAWPASASAAAAAAALVLPSASSGSMARLSSGATCHFVAAWPRLGVLSPASSVESLSSTARLACKWAYTYLDFLSRLCNETIFTPTRHPD